jgi:hypothetical protein
MRHALLNQGVVSTEEFIDSLLEKPKVIEEPCKLPIFIPCVQTMLDNNPPSIGKNKNLRQAFIALLHGHVVSVRMIDYDDDLEYHADHDGDEDSPLRDTSYYYIYHDTIMTRSKRHKPIPDTFPTYKKSTRYTIHRKRYDQYNYSTDLNGPFGAILGIYHLLHNKFVRVQYYNSDDWWVRFNHSSKIYRGGINTRIDQLALVGAAIRTDLHNYKLNNYVTLPSGESANWRVHINDQQSV